MSRELVCVESTLDITIGPGHTIRLWIDNGKELPLVALSAEVLHIRSEVIRRHLQHSTSPAALVEWLCSLPKVNAAQVIYSTEMAGVRVGIVGYAVPFEDIKG